MKIQIVNNLNKRTEYVEETLRFSESPVMSANICCLCCKDGTGDDLLCK